MAPNTDPITHPSVVSWKYLDAIPHGVLRADDTAVRELEAALRVAEASGEDTSVGNLKNTLGRALAHRDASADHQRGLEMLAEVRDMCAQRQYFLVGIPVLDLYEARERIGTDDFVAAMTTMRRAVDLLFREGQVVQGIWGSTVLVEALLEHGGVDDVVLAKSTIDRLANLPDDVSGVVRDIWLLRLRTLLARTEDDEAAYRELRDRYRAMATSLGFEGHMKWAAAMP